MLSPDLLLWADVAPEHWRCPKCGTVQRFRALRVCTGSTCRASLVQRDLTANYFRQVYAQPAIPGGRFRCAGIARIKDTGALRTVISRAHELLRPSLSTSGTRRF